MLFNKGEFNDYFTAVRTIEDLQRPKAEWTTEQIVTPQQVADARTVIAELKAKEFAQLYSRHFFPFVMLHDEYKIHLLKNQFSYWKAKKKGQRDIVFLTGDCQSLSPHGHYEVAEKILDFVEKLGVKEILELISIAIPDPIL